MRRGLGLGPGVVIRMGLSLLGSPVARVVHFQHHPETSAALGEWILGSRCYEHLSLGFWCRQKS